MDKPYFRPGAGSIIYRADGSVMIFKRTSEDIWQFPQGGMDTSETATDTLWRELKEETGLVTADFTLYLPYPTWTFYEYPDGFVLPASRSTCIGQCHKWWFLQLAPSTTIELDRAHDKEFDAWKWILFSDFIAQSEHSFKQPVYLELYEHFARHIVPL